MCRNPKLKADDESSQLASPAMPANRCSCDPALLVSLCRFSPFEARHRIAQTTLKPAKLNAWSERYLFATPRHRHRHRLVHVLHPRSIEFETVAIRLQIPNIQNQRIYVGTPELGISTLKADDRPRDYRNAMQVSTV